MFFDGSKQNLKYPFKMQENVLENNLQKCKYVLKLYAKNPIVGSLKYF